ncbi:Dephospho-CoA kinase [subsurface metagenome]
MRSTKNVVWGVAGRYCAGKDALVAFLKSKGFTEIDCDRVGHQVLAKKSCKNLVVERFGSRVLDEKGEIDRRALGELIFKSGRARRDLERILHPDLVAEVKSRLSSRLTSRLSESEGPVVINAAILFRLGLHRFCDQVICVQAPLLVRLSRAMARDRLSIRQALTRILSQRRICPKFNPAGVDIYYIKNEKNLEQLQEQALAILREKGIEGHL